MDIVVVGGGAAGLKAAARARRRDAEANITVIEAGKYVSMARCGLPYYVGGLIHELDDLRETTYGAIRDEIYFKKLKNIDVLTLTKAEEIDRKKKVVTIRRADGSEDELNYDYLVLSTGAKPVKPNIPGIDAEGVFNLFDPEDAERIIEMWENEDIERAVIIGGGLIGLEACEALKNLDLDVTLIELMDHVVPALLDREVALLVEEHLKEKGVKVMTSTRVQEIKSKDGRVSEVVAGKEIPADIVITAIGVRPNVDLASKAGLKIGETGAIKVNEFLQTSDESIYAGGDCVENIHILTGKSIYAPLGSTANKHGRVIGDNITGGRERFPGVLGTSIFKIFEFTVARSGLTEREARELGFDAYSVVVPGHDRAHYYPGARSIRLKIVVDGKTDRVIGVQGTGLGVVDKRVDVLIAAIHAGLTIDQLSHLDLAYAPPYSTALDNVITAANVARNKKDGLFDGITVFELKEKLEKDEDVVILDVRSEEEFRHRHIESDKLLHIPLLELRDRVNEIPGNKEIIVVCQLGLRSYEAQRILKGYGFNEVKVLEGGMAFWTG
jgi:NADPH-dependent 2,4-dienoyl-CoA reductase/sulfur reductase-like enzyme/rhodanese-related sulfurtransferase